MTGAAPPDLSLLYQREILAHSKAPENVGPLPGATHVARSHNPLCGDTVAVALRVDAEGRIAEVHFESRGCAIARGSASLMTTRCAGTLVADAEALRATLADVIAGADVPETHPLAPYRGVRAFPARVRCATLAWDALGEALSSGEHASHPAGAPVTGSGSLPPV